MFTFIRASTKEQDAERTKNELIQFAADHGHRITAFYIENESRAKLVRPKLIEDAHEGDVILVEQIYRLALMKSNRLGHLKKNDF